MIKSSFYILSLLVLVSCASTKMTKNEAFLSLNSSKEKIYIISVFPKDTNNDSRYMSTLLVNHTEETKQSISAVGFSYDHLDKTIEYNRFFIDSAADLGFNRFPVLAQSAIIDSNQSTFQFSFDRKKIEFSGASKAGSLDYTIAFPRQKEFVTQTLRTNFQLSRLDPLNVNFSNINNEKINQQSVFTLHTLEKPESLFNSELQYYWIDFQLFNQVFSLFLSYDGNGFIDLIYSTLPEEKYQLTTIFDKPFDSFETVFFDLSIPNTNEKLQVKSFTNTVKTTKKTGVAKPIQIMQANVEVGNGILYKL